MAIREIIDGLRKVVVFNEFLNHAWSQIKRLAASLDRLG